MMNYIFIGLKSVFLLIFSIFSFLSLVLLLSMYLSLHLLQDHTVNPAGKKFAFSKKSKIHRVQIFGSSLISLELQSGSH